MAEGPDAQPFAHELGEELREPGTESEYEHAAADTLATIELDVGDAATVDVTHRDAPHTDLPPLLLEHPGDGLHRAPRSYYARVWFVDRDIHVGRVHDRPAVPHLVRGEDLVVPSERLPVLDSLFHERRHLVSHDDVAGRVKEPRQQRVRMLLIPLLPLVDRSRGPSAPLQTVWHVTVAGTHAAGLAPGRGSRVPRAVLVEQRDLGAHPLQMQRGPVTEVPSSDYDDVRSLARAHERGARRGDPRLLCAHGRTLASCDRQPRTGSRDLEKVASVYGQERCLVTEGGQTESLERSLVRR